MNDREMLELAAKAAGIVITDWRVRLKDVSPVIAHESGCGYRFWDPLADDGDALRLAARLSIDIEWQNVGDFPEPFVEAYRRAGDGESHFCALEQVHDFRLAITRAAAEIGKQMGGSDV